MSAKKRASMRLTITITPRVPRNPLVAAAKLRQAGSHRASRKTERQTQQRALKKILKEGWTAHNRAACCMI